MKRVALVRVILALFVSLAILPTPPGMNVPAAAQSADIPQAASIDLDPPATRTVDDMLADQASGAVPNGQESVAPFRPGMDPAEYAAAKAAAAAGPKSSRPAVRQAPGGPAVAVGPVNNDGQDQLCAPDGLSGFTYFPPDVDAAAGVSQFVQTTNVHVTVWDKGPGGMTGGCFGPNLLFDVDLNNFMGYTPAGGFPNAQVLFDARVVHDDTYSRWVVTAEGFAESISVQYEFVAVSTSEDATAPWLIYQFNTRDITGSGCFWDYPQLGMDDTAILLTANVFDCAAASGRWVTINKQWAYQGIGFPFCFFSGGVAELKSWAPPKVTDLNNSTWLVRAAPAGSSLNLAQLTATSAVCPIVLGVPTVSVGAYGVPPDAPQVGSAILLDTLDARFQNRSTQSGDPAFAGQVTYLWNIHTIEAGGFPIPTSYRIKLSAGGPGCSPAPCTDETLSWFASLPSFDFNPSIAVNSAKTIAVTWSSTCASAACAPTTNAQVWVGAEAFGGAQTKALVFSSAVPLTRNGSPTARWGDYSSTTIDPTSGGIAWGANEEIDNPDDATGSTWGTRYFNASIP